jgi:tRNA(fMet)-specific endonuclease VapC
MLILDSDHVSLMYWGEGEDAEQFRRRLTQVSADDLATTIVSYEEQTRGWLAYMARAKTLEQQIEAYRRLHRHLTVYASIRMIDFGEAAAVEFQALRHLRRRIGVYDLRIAAIAKSHQATLITRNRADFEQVPGLTFEDWTRPQG